GYNPVRGGRVVAYVAEVLDRHVGLERGSYSDVVEFLLEDRQGRKQLAARLAGGETTHLADPAALAGYRESNGRLGAILPRHHGLHIEIQIDREHPVGRAHPAGVKDVVLEAAVTTIMDCEDSVSAVDAEDKVRVYRNWLGIMAGTLQASFEKGGRPVRRRPNPHPTFPAPARPALTLPAPPPLPTPHP